MAVITQDAKDKVIRELDYLKGKLQGLGLNPGWEAGAVDANQGDPALSYALIKTAIQAAVTDIDSTIGTWVT